MPQSNFELLKKGDPTALVKIHTQYSKRIYWVGRGLIRDHFVIESLVQDTFLKLWIHRDTIESPRHIVHFLRFVMKRECISYYSKPKNKFFRSIHSLDDYDNYQDYMLGYDPVNNDALQDQELNQKKLEQIKSVLPLLNTDKRHLIQLCLKYGFQYKAIAQAMGTSINKTSSEIKMAVSDIRTIINHGDIKKARKRPPNGIKIQCAVTQIQKRVFELRCKENYSFDFIAITLNLSQKEVHKQFMIAYKLMQQEHQSQLS